MKKKAVSKLMVNWIASFVSVILLLSMMAVPALAVLAANTVNSAAIINGQVRTPDLAGDAVTSAKIKNGQVKRADIAAGAVVSGRIADGAVTTAKIRNGHVRSADIALGAVLSGRIANGAVTSAKIRDGNVAGVDIAANAIDSGKIANETITNADIATNAAISDSKFKYSTKTGYLSVSPMALTPKGPDSSNYVKGALFLRPLTLAQPASYGAGITLPNGAKITKLRFSASDLYDDGSVIASILQSHHSGTGWSVIADSGHSATTGWQTLVNSSVSRIVENNNYSYSVSVGFTDSDGSSLSAGNIVIEYEYASPGS